MTNQLPAPGQTVTFRGGSGRADHARTLTGIVNGEPIHYQTGIVYIPVHLPETNHNVMVDSLNLVAADD